MEETLLATLWLILGFVILGQADALPCHVTSNHTAFCRGQNLDHVPPDLPRSLERLDLSYNKIQQIGDFSAFPQLRDLDLSFNNILSIADDAFASNVLLEKLNLFNNSLEEIPSQAVRPLKRLKMLSMSNNLYNYSTLDGVFRTLKNLEELSMGGPAIETVGSRDFLPLKEIPLKKFALKTSTSLRMYQKGAFSNLNTTALWCDISLDKNPAALPVMLQDLRGKPMQCLRFRNLFQFTYYMDSEDPFSGLAEVEAEQLVFFRGKFNENLLRMALLNIEKSSIQDLALIAIDFARSLEWEPPTAGYANLTLRHLVLQDISNPDILRFDWTFTWFTGVTYLSILNVNFNFVPCDAWGEMSNVVVLNTSHNRLQNSYIYNERCQYQDIMPNLEVFNLSYNELTSLKKVATLTSSWPRFSYLDLSHNQIGVVNELPCAWSPSLIWLALPYNMVTMDIFRCLPTTLRFLDLSYSQLERLDTSYFEAAVDLQELFLSGNKIKFIPIAWRSPNLRILEVDGNSFGAISKGSFVNMPHLAQLKAGNNPYHCVCDLYGFLQETFRKGKLSLQDWPSSWTCYHPESLLDTDVAAYTPRVFECDVTIVVAIAVSITATVVIICMVLCWRFDVPWYLKATFHIVRSKYRARHSSPSQHFAYDAFISYSSSDAEWVRRELLQRLEVASPAYRVCIHERDFTPGRWIIDNIIDNIENSRKIIFVLSHSFVDSEWCNYELYFAHQRAVGMGFEDVVLVVKEAIDPEALPNKFCKLRKMLSKKTYLEWPAESSRQAFFWVQLKSVLGKAETFETDPAIDFLTETEQTSEELTDGPLEMGEIAEGNTTVATPVAP
ncbi:toll-like receptor 2 [Hemicordylus capensis]|uniref:toll-like receptor 2 n=1 Tax=Hemicordylus capensis TaxID=884348 RepID=UPI0023021867|nr:toll-like receptor 2 [Hemicordylus capensis]XP_053134664.1 toll-like receptor 2 [Hemicordylus capensis]XP_053134665.1 toll-like receptor 2 [Hemicordylus capensis]XP_053134666.1 toll-like receptor 2 [Hemicordylus capensis]XP_053134667.1 toll-like receptor 2 [Hemicordylus capensis]XP_053134668.1 toll-like receptor 2 [Hemicordylus capensis]XP_053134669.1 toll-like receptor 2 [Hemicordylus capensis]XP_053134670.1 toll-like receptor 2 [Hemicordylus capensis]